MKNNYRITITPENKELLPHTSEGETIAQAVVALDALTLELYGQAMSTYEHEFWSVLSEALQVEDHEAKRSNFSDPEANYTLKIESNPDYLMDEPS